MRTIGKFLLFIINFVVCICVVVGSISLFLNKAGFLDINEEIAKVPFLKEFVVEETYKNNIETKFENYEKELNEKEDLISAQELTIKQLEADLDSLKNDYKLLEKEIADSYVPEDANNNDIIGHYNSMKDKKVAEIFNTMSNEEVVNILSQMDSDKVPKILENMEVQKVSKITELFLKSNNNM
ncbi:MAG: hypothetical protein IJH34_07770 [Romboutsia sp.]|nr:hypothetical protein [Romboutsia sp.]